MTAQLLASFSLARHARTTVTVLFVNSWAQRATPIRSGTLVLRAPLAHTPLLLSPHTLSLDSLCTASSQYISFGEAICSRTQQIDLAGTALPTPTSSHQVQTPLTLRHRQLLRAGAAQEQGRVRPPAPPAPRGDVALTRAAPWARLAAPRRRQSEHGLQRIPLAAGLRAAGPPVRQPLDVPGGAALAATAEPALCAPAALPRGAAAGGERARGRQAERRRQARRRACTAAQAPGAANAQTSRITAD